MARLILANAGLPILRIAVGTVMAAHGWPKLQNHKEMGEMWQENWGFPRQSALVSGLSETAGGAALAAGILSRWSALLLFSNMLVATYVASVKLEEPFNSSPEKKGWDVNLLLLGALLTLIFAGNGGKH